MSPAKSSCFSRTSPIPPIRLSSTAVRAYLLRAWAYKYEEALRRGAPASSSSTPIDRRVRLGRGTQLVGRAKPVRQAGAGGEVAGLEGWVTRSRRKVAGAGGQERRRVARRERTPRFRPIPLGIQCAASSPPRSARSIRETSRHGSGQRSETQKRSRRLQRALGPFGIGTPVKGDAIYNGAIDNATGCGILLELARAWAALPQKPRRTALFLR